MLLGDVGAGKSSLVLRFVKDQFVEFQVCGSRITFLVVCFTFWCLLLDFDDLLGYRNQPSVQLFSHKH